MDKISKGSLSIVTLTFLSGLFLVFTPGVAHGAFGISPPFLNADHLVPGVTYTQTVYLVQDKPDQDLPIKASLTFPDHATPWVNLDTGFNFTIPQGVRQFPVKITIQVPQGEGLGKYSGNLAFTSQPTKTGQVTIALGVNVAINITVGEGIFEQYSVPLITFPDIEEGWNPTVYIKFKNDGNVPEAFDSATFEILDQYDAVRLAYITKQDDFPVTPAFSTNEYTIEFPTDFHLGIGQYWGVATIYKDGKVVATQKTIFNVLKAGSILGFWGRSLYWAQRNQGTAYAIGVGAAALIVFIGWSLGRRRRSRKSRSS